MLSALLLFTVGLQVSSTSGPKTLVAIFFDDIILACP